MSCTFCTALLVHTFDALSALLYYLHFLALVKSSTSCCFAENIKPSYMQVQRLTSTAVLPVSQNHASPGYTICSSVETTLQPWTRYVIPTGLALRPPPGTYLQLLTHNESTVSHNIVVQAGCIFPSHSGEVKVCLFNCSATPCKIDVGQPIAYVVCIRIMKPIIALSNDISTVPVSPHGFHIVPVTSSETN